MSFRRRACLAALIVAAAASVSPATAFAGAGDECGVVGVPPAGNVIVASGTITCADAMAVVNRYFSDFSLTPENNEWIRFDGWDCWTPSADQAMVNGFGTECGRGGDNIQIRR
jgi:hypothetical protein